VTRIRLLRSASWPTASVEPAIHRAGQKIDLVLLQQLSDFRTATGGLASSSSNRSSKGRPFTPPAALISLTASSAPTAPVCRSVRSFRTAA